VLPRTTWLARIPLLRCEDVLIVPAEFGAAVRATAGEVVSSVQRPLAGELVGDLGAFAILPILLYPVACRLYALTREAARDT